MDFPVGSYSFLPGSRAILDLSYRSRLRNSNYTMSQQSRPTISMVLPSFSVGFLLLKKFRNFYTRAGLVVWPIRGQITRFWLLFFVLGLKKKVWLFGYFLASFYFKEMLGKCFDLSLILYA